MDFIIGVLAAWGLVMLVWTLAGAVLLPLSRTKGLRLTVLVRGRGQVPQLERYIRGLLWLRDSGLVWWDVLLLDQGLSEDARQRAVKIAEKERQVSLGQMDSPETWE